MSLPEKVKLDAKDATALKQLGDKQRAVADFVQLISQQGEKRLAELQGQTNDFWTMAKNKYNLPLETVNYTLDNDGEHIIPISMKLI